MADSKISALPASTTPLAGTEVLPIVQSSTTKQVSVANLTAGRDIAATSLTTAAVQATNSGGLSLKNSSGTTQLSLGAGGGDNITLSVATNITPANAAVAISPTGTGTVTINPTTASTMNNVSVGATTALTGRFTTVTATTGNFVVGTSGQGIDFSATPGTGTSELLNDYEEGTWTPTYTSVGATFTYTEQYGSYIKIGSLVTAQFRINAASASGTTTNAAQVTGFPFSSANNGPLSDSAGAIGLNTFPGGQVCPQMAPNSTLLNLWISNTTGLVSAIQTVGSYCIVTVCYQAA
tara:strand:- start:530 stop:1411 length:882 start_codon:yes stop_codon:yes gene_type:complete